MNSNPVAQTTTTLKKPWLASYPKGIPAEVDVLAFSSLLEVLENSFERFQGKPAFSNMGRVLSYADLDRSSRDFGAFLQHELGLKKGDRLAIMMPNLLQYAIALFGAIRAGLVITNINPLYTPRELKHQLVDSGASAIVIVENYCHVLAQVLPATSIKTIITTHIGDLLGFPKSTLVNFVVKHIKQLVPAYHLPAQIDFHHALSLGKKNELKTIGVDRDDLVFLQYTAGTTGVSKGVKLTHGNLIANLQQTSAWIAPLTEEGKEVIITSLPLYHIFSLTANCLEYMKNGGLNVLITNPRDLKGFVHELKKVRFTAITGVNTLFNALLNTPGFSEVDFSALKIALGGGMPVQQHVAKRWKEVTGCTLVEAYGLTETSPGVCINPVDLKDFNGAVGLPLPSTECSIQDEADHILPVGDVGEICVRGPQVMKGYWRQPEKTMKVLRPDGWFHSGDLGTMDERGFVKILERKDDMILVSGFNIYPSEIENVVAEHPGVKEVAAIGVPDEKSGEAVKVFVVLKETGLSEEALKEYCRQNLTAYKIPKYIEFRESLPKSNVGKILRRALRK